MNISDKPSVYINIENRRILTTGENKGKAHIKLWVTFLDRSSGKKKWRQRPYKLNLFATPKEFERIMNNKVNNSHLTTDLLTIRNKVNEAKARAVMIIDKFEAYTQDSFEGKFLSKYAMEDIALYFNEKINECERLKKISSREKYETALYSLTMFFKKDRSEEEMEKPVLITFDMLTAAKLQEYEDWYSAKKSLTSVGINMRCLRHIFKRAIKNGTIPVTLFPFGLGGYVIPEGGDDTKKFMDTDEKLAFINWEPPTERMAELHDYALFSFFGFGMNMSDVARLRRDKVFKDYLTIDRQKTKGRKKKKKITSIPLHQSMREIIQKHGKRSLIPDDFVFPILEYGDDEETIFYKIRDLVDDVNKMLKIMVTDHPDVFTFTPTSYTLRHTFAFTAMELGATTEELQDMLSHGTKQTTENYKHGFSLDRKKKFSDGLGK
jgi:integrase/recombinase XerD